MLIAAIQIELSISWAMSLKDKRHVVKGLKDRLHRRYNCATAEVADNDLWRSAVLGIAIVGNDARYLQGVAQKIVNFVEEYNDATLEDFTIEII